MLGYSSRAQYTKVLYFIFIRWYVIINLWINYCQFITVLNLLRVCSGIRLLYKVCLRQKKKTLKKFVPNIKNADHIFLLLLSREKKCVKNIWERFLVQSTTSFLTVSTYFGTKTEKKILLWINNCQQLTHTHERWRKHDILHPE